MAVAIAAVASTACSDDETSNLVINNGITEVTINRLGGKVEIPVTADGEWTATISGNEMDELPWSNVYQEEGNGKGVLAVAVDYFNPALQMHERKAQITVKSGDKSQVITLRQFIGLEDGETAPNDSTGYLDIWHDKGVGKPLNPLTGDIRNNFVLNTATIIEMAKGNDKRFNTLFSQATLPGMNSEVHLNDSLENNNDSLGVHCKITVKFAKFKLGLEVDYKNHGDQKWHNAVYTGSQDVEFLKAGISTADIAAILEEEWDEAKNNWKAGTTLHNDVVSPGFLSAWVSVMKNRDNQDKFQKAIKNIISKFGPVLVDGATLGGSIFTAIKYDSISIKDNFNVSGTVTANVALAAIQISGKVEAGYYKNGTDIWQNSESYCSISGGSSQSYEAILKQLEKDLPDREALRDAAQKWMASIRCTNNKDDNADVISIEYTGIWNLFPFDVADEIQDYIIDYYKGKKLCVDLENMGILKTKKQ